LTRPCPQESASFWQAPIQAVRNTRSATDEATLDLQHVHKPACLCRERQTVTDEAPAPHAHAHQKNALAFARKQRNRLRSAALDHNLDVENRRG